MPGNNVVDLLFVELPVRVQPVFVEDDISDFHQSSVKEIDWPNLHRFPKSDAFLYLSNLT